MLKIDRNRHVNTGDVGGVGCGVWGVLHPQSFTQSENLRAVGKFKAFQKKLGQSEFKIGTNYTIKC